MSRIEIWLELILLPNGQASVIVSIGIYYCLLPLNMDTMEPIIDIEMPYRTVTTNINKRVVTIGQQDIYDFLKGNQADWFTSRELSEKLNISIAQLV